MAFVRIETIVTGHVQGVGYRFFVERMAGILGITGWVSNLPDGSVKVVGIGTEDKISDFLLTLKEGSSLSRVDEVKTNRTVTEYNDFDSFEIML